MNAAAATEDHMYLDHTAQLKCWGHSGDFVNLLRFYFRY